MGTGTLDEDLRMGYALQTQISKTYFERYISSMRRWSPVVTPIPLEVA